MPSRSKAAEYEAKIAVVRDLGPFGGFAEAARQIAKIGYQFNIGQWYTYRSRLGFSKLNKGANNEGKLKNGMVGVAQDDGSAKQAQGQANEDSSSSDRQEEKVLSVPGSHSDRRSQAASDGPHVESGQSDRQKEHGQERSAQAPATTAATDQSASGKDHLAAEAFRWRPGMHKDVESLARMAGVVEFVGGVERAKHLLSVLEQLQETEL